MYVRDDALIFAGVPFAGFGAVKYAGVTKLQKLINEFALGETKSFKIEEDGEYGGCTHGALQDLRAWYATTHTSGFAPSAAGGTILDEQGPKAIASMLTGIIATNKLSLGDLDDIQAGYEAWVARGKPACGAGGSKPPATVDLTDDDGEILGPSPQKAGLGTVGWFLIGLGVVAAIGAGYWWLTKPPAGQ